MNFDGVRVPESARLAAEGDGFRIAMQARAPPVHFVIIQHYGDTLIVLLCTARARQLQFLGSLQLDGMGCLWVVTVASDVRVV